MFRYGDWHESGQHWTSVGRELGIEHRQVEDSQVAGIRDTLPFGPPNPVHVMDLSTELGMLPISVFRLWAGETFKRPQAFPDWHPMGLNLRAKSASAQKERYAGQKHRKAVGEAQDWKCKFCQQDISAKGASALDHIIPIARGGVSTPDNLQLLCRRCNIRKSDHAPNEYLDQYMERKVSADRLVDLCNEVLPPIVDRFIWQDSTEAACPWCQGETKVVQAAEAHEATVFKCAACKRQFRAGHWDGKEDFYQHVQDAIFSPFPWGEAIEVVGLLKAGDIEGVKRSVAELAGYLEEVRRRRHTHRDPRAGCWCEFGDDGWNVVGRYDQITLEIVGADEENRQWGAGIDAMLDSIATMYEAEDAAESE